MYNNYKQKYLKYKKKYLLFKYNLSLIKKGGQNLNNKPNANYDTYHEEGEEEDDDKYEYNQQQVIDEIDLNALESDFLLPDL